MTETASFHQRIYDLLTAHPGVPFDGIGLARVGGVYAWRSRVAAVRQQLQREGKGTIKWTDVRLENGQRRSLYTFIPAPWDAHESQ